MKLATSYFGNRIPRHVARDMAALRGQGFARVIHTFSENDHAFYAETIGELVKISHEEGLEVLLDPWGVGRIFGGEAFSNWITEDPDLCQRTRSGRPLAGACLNHPGLRKRLEQWTLAAAATGADGVFWDEPHWVPRGPRNPQGEPCICPHCRQHAEKLFGRPIDLTAAGAEEIEHLQAESVLALLQHLSDHAAALDLPSSVCLLPRGVLGQPQLSWERVAGMRHIDEFGTDPYWQAFGIEDPVERDRFIDEQAGAACAAARAARIPVMLWIQAFRIPADREGDLLAGARRLLRHAPDTVALWGFEACAHMSALRCERSAQLWTALLELLHSGAGR